MEGPYFEDSLPYCEAPGDDRELTHYISPGWLKRIADLPGSPIVVLDRVEFDAMNASLALMEQDRDELKRRLEEVSAPQVVVSPVDVDALAGALIVPLSDHFARKPGPKPRAA